MRGRSARPFRRSLWKLAARIVCGSRRAHFHSWLPSLSVQQLASGAPGIKTVSFRGRPVLQTFPVADLRERAGETIHIIGSGPSIRDNDLSQIGKREAILLNGAISLLRGTIDEPLAIMIEDERFVWRHFDLMREVMAADIPCLFSLGVIRALCEIDIDWLQMRPVFLLDDLRKPYGRPRRSAAELGALAEVRYDTETGAGISFAPDIGTFSGGSVAVTAIQIAIACAPRLIGLFGIDISNANAPRFYEREADTASSGIAEAEARILSHFALAREICEESGISLLCFSRVSALLGVGIRYDDRFARKDEDVG